MMISDIKGEQKNLPTFSYHNLVNFCSILKICDIHKRPIILVVKKCPKSLIFMEICRVMSQIEENRNRKYYKRKVCFEKKGPVSCFVGSIPSAKVGL